MKALVTGGAGFIGSHIVDELTAAGWDVTVVDNFSTGLLSNITHRQLRIASYDVRTKAVYDLIKYGDFDVIFHLAANVNVSVSEANPRYDADTNIMGTVNILQAVSECEKKPRVVFSSSCAVYGDALYPNEFTPRRPLSAYGLSKKCAEEYINYYQSKGVISAVLRYANVYGPRQGASGEGGVVSVFANNIRNGQTFTIYGDGKQTRDFIHVKDVVRANILVATIDISESYMWNIGTSFSISINTLAHEMNDQGLEIKDGYLATLINYEPSRQGEIRDSCLDCGFARTELGFTASVELGEGLRDTIEWVLKQP